jgi:HK97 gp10 family phage protein
MSALKITFQTVSAKGALLGGPQFLENIKKIARKATFVAATKAHKEMARRIRVPKSGNLSDRAGRQRLNAKHLALFGHKVADMKVTTTGKAHAMFVQNFHVASAPGESPANDTGNLLQSIQVVQIQAEQGGTITSEVIVKARYAKWLEYGTKKMEPRPFVRPTLRFITPIFKEYMAQKLRKLNKGEVDTGGGES